MELHPAGLGSSGEGSLDVPVLPRIPAGFPGLVPRALSPGSLPIQADTTHPLTKHRKIASSFRDSSLFDIFTLSCSLLKQVRRGLESFLGSEVLGQRVLG